MIRTIVGTIALTASLAASGADVGVSVTVQQPGFYGRIDIGDRHPPPIIYAQPLVIRPAPIAALRPPIYLRVPPGHAKRWDKHCARYGACGQPVYFVREDWYRTVYLEANGPYAGHRVGRDHGHGHGSGKAKGHHKNRD